jgi:hypothetical protein
VENIMSKIAHVIIASMLLVLWSAVAAVSEPIRWSAPMNEYPSQWYPTAPPPQYNNQYGYGNQYPYSGYGYGNWGGYQGGQGGFSGNPYYYYYGQ